MFEIWRHRTSGERFLVAVRDGRVNVAAGPLPPGKDPRRVLETHGCQAHNPLALLDIRRTPGAYAREYTTDRRGRAVPVTPAD
jgi:hypothetical protein